MCIRDRSKEQQTDTKDKQETSADPAKNTTADAEKPKTETVSLRQALKLEDGLDASFENYDVTDSVVSSFERSSCWILISPSSCLSLYLVTTCAA